MESDPVVKRVPNSFPLASPGPGLPRLAIIGEAPGADEERLGKPFVGQSGRLLDQLLSGQQIARDRCFVGNICQVRPPDNDLAKIDKQFIQEGVIQLKKDLEQFNPNCCLLLGKTALLEFTGRKSLGDWRGSVMESSSFVRDDFTGYKCLPSYHPAAILRQYEWLPLLTFDLKRAWQQAAFPELRLPVRNLWTSLTFNELVYELSELLRTKPKIACDIEGGVENVSCISFATSATLSFVVPFTHVSGASFWTADEEVELWRLVAEIMADEAICKIWQNGLYDRFVLQMAHSIVVRGPGEDTMLKWWELYHELEKSLAVQASILTEEPYYKFERKAESEEAFFRYCCKDSAVTFEINEKLDSILFPEQIDHYKFNVDVLDSLLYMELRGIRYDEQLARERFDAMQTHVYTWQEKLDAIARKWGVLKGIDFDQPGDAILAQVNEVCGYKKDKTKPRQNFVDDGYWEVHGWLIEDTKLSLEQRGRISNLCKATLNTKSPKFKDFLYGTCKLPVQWKKDPKTKEMRPTTDYLSLLKLSKTHDDPALKVALELSLHRTRCQFLATRSYNGRMHCSYNLVGSETGRVTSSKAMLYTNEGRVGTNLQTVPDDWDVFGDDHPLAQGMRDLFLADEGCFLGKCDLKGSDGWSIGAYMTMLGDSTMLDDLKYGLKPAQIVAYILRHGAGQMQQHSRDREKLRELCAEIKKEDWEYFVSKQGMWGTCYTMGPRKLAERVFIESEG